MTVIVIEPPSPVVTVAEAKRHLRIEADITEDDAHIEGLIAAATAWLDGPDGWLGRALGGQILEWQSDTWPCVGFGLPYPPEVEILSIKYIDPGGDEQTWPIPSPLYFDDLPAVRGRSGDIKIRYRAGYGAFNNEDPPVWVNAIPAPLRVAILMLVAQWYETREAVTVGVSAEEVPNGVKALVQPYRVYR
jgi:uncharacterized phiE125 gp8 family phage protein